MAAHFVPPPTQDNSEGWGPMGIPERFKDLPYQPFSKVIQYSNYSVKQLLIFLRETDVRVGWWQ